jgi:hypothetical protein
MNLMKFILLNWDSILVALAVIGALSYIVVKKRWDLLDKVLFGIVTWAEREYGGGTGALKLAVAIEKIYPQIPAIIRAFVSTTKLEQLVDKALAAAKLKWERNPKLLESAANSNP